MIVRLLLRAGQMLLVVLAVVTITFFVLRLATGDPARLVNPPGTPEDVITQTRQRLGTDRPLFVQYGDYLLNLTRGNLGVTFRGSQPVREAVLNAIPNTLALAGIAVVTGALLALTLGSLAARRPNGLFDRVVLTYTAIAQATPAFWLAVVLVFFFSLRLGWFPAIDMTGPDSFVLPVATLVITLSPILIRTVRQSFVETQGEDFIRAARARGLSERRVFLIHGLKIAALPLLTLIGLQLGFLLAGAVVVEAIFNWPGIGKLILDAVASRDFPMIQGGVLVAAVSFVVLNFVVDLLYSVLDPPRADPGDMTDALAAAEISVASARTTGRRRLRAITQRPTALAGLLGVAAILAVAVFAPVLAPSDPAVQNLSNILAPPMWVDGGSAEHLLGTDALGRDLASRLMFGARNSLLVSVSAMLLASTLGLATGLVAGFLGGKIDTVLMRLGDIQLAFPFILLAIAFLGVLTNRTPLHLILVLGIPGWIVYARVVRSRVLAERESQYVQAAAALGASRTRQLLVYVLPSVWHVVPVIALLDVGFLVIMESTLSFLGIGLPPRDPSWGAILAEGRRNMLISPWLPILPGLAIMATVLSLNLVADGLADVLDPKLRKGTFRRTIPRQPAPVDPDEQDQQLLKVRDLHVEFPLRDKVVLGVRGVSFDLPRGRTLGIVGESGSGKSVTALSLMQLLDSPGRVTRGRIVFDGEDLARIPDRRMAALRGRQLAMIFQNPTTSLNPVLSIGFQMAEAVRSHRPQADTAAVVREGLRSVGIGDVERILRQYPFQLSGGMNQRVMIAIAMSAHPDLLIADEPTTALDVTTQAQILEQLQRLTSGQDTSLILISHDLAIVAEYADLVMVMYAGQVCEFGPVAEVVAGPHHPYTRALLESVPRADLLEGASLTAIPGELPDPTTVTKGCPFAPRCPSVMDICREVNPDQYEVGPAHRAACHLWSPQSVQVQAR